MTLWAANTTGSVGFAADTCYGAGGTFGVDRDRPLARAERGHRLRERRCRGHQRREAVTRFEQLVENSPFRVASFEAVPIRRLRWMRTTGLREFTTSIVRCRLELPALDVALVS